MKFFIVIVFVFTFSFDCFSQDKNENVISNNFSFDTLIKPDYFEVRITTRESTYYIGKRRSYTYKKLDLDSSSKALKANLAKLGFSNELKKISIDEVLDSYGRKEYYFGQILFQVSYEFIISSKDSVDYLFEKLPKENITSLITTPKIKESTLEKIKDTLTAKSLVKMKKIINTIADSTKNKIVNQKTIGLNFYPKVKNQVTYSSLPKDFLIDTKDLEYSFNIYFSFSTEKIK